MAKLFPTSKNVYFSTFSPTVGISPKCVYTSLGKLRNFTEKFYRVAEIDFSESSGSWIIIAINFSKSPWKLFFIVLKLT